MPRAEAFPTSSRLACTLLAVWEAGQAGSWLVLTDLPAAAAANPAWYAWRMWVEQGFRAVQRGLWQWQRSQMTAADRAARLWAVWAVATLWLVEAGGGGWPADLPAMRYGLSARKEGLVRLLAALWRNEPLPGGAIVHPDWPQRPWQSDPRTKPMMDQC